MCEVGLSELVISVVVTSYHLSGATSLFKLLDLNSTTISIIFFQYHGKKPILSTALDRISMIGCGLSIAALAITLITFVAFRYV